MNNMSNKLIVTLRVKNAILFIKAWLECYEKLADGIVVVDNGSDDGTYEILKNHPKVLVIEQTIGFDEGRDFKLLLEIAKKQNPDWLITVDADEIFETRLTRSKVEAMMNSTIFSHFRFRRFHMFGDEYHYMATNQNLRSLCDVGDRSMYRFSEKLVVPEQKIHTSIMGRPKLYWQSSYRIRHLPMLHKEYRLKAYENYLKVDENTDHSKIYQRDINDLMQPENVRTFKFKDKALFIYLEYLFFNMVTLIVTFPKKLILKSIKK